MRTIVSEGLGVNGVAMLVYMKRQCIIPDAILFADTGGEREELYTYRDYLNKWLLSVGFPQITTVTYKNKMGRRITLEQDVINTKTLPSISFGFKTCSQKHKIFPQQKWVKRKYGDEKIEWFIGFDSGEVRRIKENPTKNHINRYPLIEAGWSRDMCVEEIKKEGLIVPGKSACIWCRNSKKHEIVSLSDANKIRVKRIESNAIGLNTVVGLGGRFRFTDVIDGDTKNIDQHEKDADDFKKITGEDFDQIPCECI